MIEFDIAHHEINELFMLAWNTNAQHVVKNVPLIYWQSVQNREIPDRSQYWARLSKQTVSETQSTLSTYVGAPGQKRYTASGLVFVQLFCPASDPQAFARGQRLAMIARNAFRGKTTPGKVWFRHARIHEIDPEELYYRFNVVAEFEYDECG